MATRMLIDAAHPEEVRVVAIKGNRLEEFDFETASKRPLKGNIYLAKVTRVEPSLQAAFVEYGGNRHGFLAFSEIHPDYYQIPIEDREALLREEAEAATLSDEEEAEAEAEAEAKSASGEETAQTDEDGEEVEIIDNAGEEDELEELPPRRAPRQRRYKIQEVIKRRQILLVQVVKEERGNKGAALTTYLSLAGRYAVLMPNTARGGGISRKITNPADRKRLRAIVNDLDLPEGIGVILRTAGMKRTKTEIKRDFEFLLRQWDEIRKLTLESVAPALVYEEASLIKRAIRDLYNKDISEILVEGEEGYRTAKDFMKKLMPSHAKKVQRYKDRIPLFHRYQVEQQLDTMYNPEVTLPSGGYIVINQTEALVAIDVNSGRSTKEHNIEETAYKTNLEAAEEVARQLRLRDLAGLIVIDFIDMDENRNNRAVERRLKEALRGDRARIQVGRISGFGLLEMSRQRLRPSVLEISTEKCPACNGSGIIRSTDSTALHVLRAIEEEGIRERSEEITVHVPTAVALYILNKKRAVLGEIEQRYGFRLFIESDDSLIPPNYRLERKAPASGDVAVSTAVQSGAPDDAQEEETPPANEEGSRKKRRRRGRRRKKSDDQQVQAQDTPQDNALTGDGEGEGSGEVSESSAETTGAEETQSEEGAEPRKRSRRSRRGSRRRKPREDAESAAATDEAGDDMSSAAPALPAGTDDAESGMPADNSSASSDTPAEVTAANEEEHPQETGDGGENGGRDEPAPRKRPRRRRSRKPAADTAMTEEAASPATEASPVTNEQTSPTPEPGETAAEPRPIAAMAPLDIPPPPPAADISAGNVPAMETPSGEVSAKDSPSENVAASLPETGDSTIPAMTQEPAAETAQAEAAVIAEPPAGDEAVPDTPAAVESTGEQAVDTTAPAPAAEEKPKPKKRGWWRRG